MPFRITTWNVNGIRNPFGYQPWREKRTFEAMFDILEADIVVMQELKIQRKDLRDDMVLVPGWDCYFSLPKHKKGYSGVGVYTRQSKCAPIRAEEGILGVLCPPNSSIPYCELPADQHIGGYPTLLQQSQLSVDAAALDSEGRCVVLEFPAFVLFGIYSPANSSGTRDDFRYGFLNALDMRIRNLVGMGKKVIVTGDLNVSRSEIDTANAEETIRKEGLSHEEYMSSPNRKIFNQLLEDGEVPGERDEGREIPVMWDICRGFHERRKGMFTHWEQKINARPGNFGSRIDFILCSLTMKHWFSESNIQEGLMGSDHCPVYAIMKDTIDNEALLDKMNPVDTFHRGIRQKEFNPKTPCAFSARLLPEFDKRRTIKSMFIRRPSLRKEDTQETSSESTLDQPAIEDCIEVNEHTQDQQLSLTLDDDSALPSVSSQATVSAVSTKSTTASPERKRSAAETMVAKANKKARSNGANTGSTVPLKGQQSLKGFFTAKSTTTVTKERDTNASLSETAENKVSNGARVSRSESNLEAEIKGNYSQERSPILQQQQLSNASDILVDPIVSKESWSKLFSKPTVPRCEDHDEPCKIMKTKKPGFNCGREFYMCARPLGPSGKKERNTQWRCATFIWSSDWTENGK